MGEPMVTIVKAVYQNGMFKPVVPVNLTEGEWVELEFARPARQRKRNVVAASNQHPELEPDVHAQRKPP